MNLFALVNGSPWFFGPVTFSGSITFAGSALFANGTAAAPSISFANDTGTGFYRQSSGIIGFSTGSALGLRFGYATIYGPSVDNIIQLPANGSVNIATAGTNQNLTLAPNGSGVARIANQSGAGTRTRLEIEQTGTRIFYLENTATTADLAIGDGGGEYVRIVGGSGNFLLGTTTNSGNGRLQLATHTTSAGGIGFGTEYSLYRINESNIALNSTSVFSSTLGLYLNGALKGSVGTDTSNFYIGSRAAGFWTVILSGNSTTALTLDSSQRCILAGALRLNNAYTVGAPIATGYVTLQDSTGTTYKVLVGT